jgi:hypothetical protein
MSPLPIGIFSLAKYKLPGEIQMLQPLKEYEVHSSDGLISDSNKSLDEIFREVAQDGSLYE